QSQQQGNPKISRNTRAHIRLAALNANGRNGTEFYKTENRWNEINRLLFDEKVGAIAIGETHLVESQVDEIEKIYKQRLRVYNCIDVDHPNKGGVAVVLNRELTNTEGVTVRRLIPGRAILVVLPWHGTMTLTILAVYAPADSMAENKIFWDKLTDLYLTEDIPVPDSLLGDTNIVEESVDRYPHRKDADAATAAHARFKRTLGLLDGWRATNPDLLAYTYSHPSGSHSRIDRILVTNKLFKSCRRWEITNVPVKTDHRMVSVDIYAPGAPFIGKGRYAIPLFLLKDKEYMSFALKEGAKVLPEDGQLSEDVQGMSLQQRFKWYKDGLQEFAQKRAKENIGALEKAKDTFETQCKALLNGSGGSTPEPAMSQKERAV
ncbi:Endonuclease/exonuclease/phosphatase, partial [Mycena polygramma]